MNVYTYFQRIPVQESDVPSKNLPLYRWSIFQIKKSNIKKDNIQKLCSFMYDQLQDDETLNEQEYKQMFKDKVKEVSQSSIISEIIDFPLIQMIFIVILHHIYTGLLVPVLEGKEMVLGVPIGLGFILRVFGTYGLIKLLMVYFAQSPNRGQIQFWIVLGFSFFAYLSIQHYSNLWDQTPWMICPLWIWIIYNCILLGSSVWWSKRNIV